MGYFANIVQELMIEDVAGYREMFSMSFLVISLSFYRIQIARHFSPCLQMTFKKASVHAYTQHCCTNLAKRLQHHATSANVA